jgi:hypothetical protein
MVSLSVFADGFGDEANPQSNTFCSFDYRGFHLGQDL